MTDISSARRRGRPCLICELPTSVKRRVEAEVELGVSKRVIAAHGQFSESSLRRHAQLHMGRNLPEVVGLEWPEAPSTLAARLVEIADSMRLIRRGAVMAGNTLSAVRSADAETRAITALADKLGVEDSQLLSELTEYRAVVRASLHTADELPEARAGLLRALEAHGDSDLATQVREILEAQKNNREART